MTERGDMDGNGNRAYSEMARRVGRIRRRALWFATWVLAFNAALYVALVLLLGDTKRSNEVFTNTFQYQAMAWCCFYMYPYFSRMEIKTDIGLEQGRDVANVLQGVKTEAKPIMDDVKLIVADEVKPIINDVKAIVADFRKVVEKYGKDDMVKGAIEEVRKILDSEGGVVRRIERKFDQVAQALTAPIGPRRPGLLESGIRRPGEGPSVGARPPEGPTNGGA